MFMVNKDYQKRENPMLNFCKGRKCTGYCCSKLLWFEHELSTLR